MLMPPRITFVGAENRHLHPAQDKLSAWIDVVDDGVVPSKAKLKTDDGNEEDPNTWFVSFDAIERIIVASRAL